MPTRIGNLLVDLKRLQQEAKQATSSDPNPLQRHRGEERFRQALQVDTIYRGLVAIALASGAVADLGFGKLVRVDAVSAALWGIAVIGLMASATLPLRSRLLAAGLGILISVATVVALWRASAVTGADATRQAILIVMGLTIMGVGFLNLFGRTFVTIAATVLILHLGGAVWWSADLHSPVWLQMPFAVIEFGCLVAAGYRYTVLSMLRFPMATYRIAPLCITPRLDQSIAHPLQINSV